METIFNIIKWAIYGACICAGPAGWLLLAMIVSINAEQKDNAKVRKELSKLQIEMLDLRGNK